MSSDDFKVLQERGWLAMTARDFRAALLSVGQVHVVAAGEVFSRVGDTRFGLWGIVEGQVAITSAINGADSPPGLLWHPGNWGGYMPLFQRARTANCRATIESRIFAVSYPKVRALLEAQPGWWEYMGLLAMDNSLSFASVASDLLLKPPRRRIAALMLNQAACRQSGDPVAVLHLSQADLGEMANLTRHPVADILLDFENNGWLERGYRTISIGDAPALRRVANGE